MDTPIRYAGGKTKAFKIISSHIPIVPKPPRIISPFMGGGSMESRWASEWGIHVLGFDIFKPLVIFWQSLLNNPEKLANELQKLNPTADEYYKIKEVLVCWIETQNILSGWHTDYYKRQPLDLDNYTAAAYYFFNHNLSYGPMYLGWISKIYQNQRTWDNMINKIKNYHNPNLSVNIGSFEQIIPDYPTDFIYCDPPYFLEKDQDNKMFKGIYPNANFDVHHSGFDHEKLRDLLYNHRGSFILSYNNCATIREYYRDFDQYFPQWHYSYSLGETRIGKNKAEVGNKPKESHEILIVKI